MPARGQVPVLSRGHSGVKAEHGLNGGARRSGNGDAQCTCAREAQVAMRCSREAGLKAMHTMTQNYATLVSGVLIGLSEALEQGKKTKL